MARLQLVHIRSIAELRDVAARWDDLWWRSDVAMPAARAELVAQWVEQFAPRARFHALAVTDGQQFVAALPLVGRKIAPLVTAGDLPGNEWAPSGQLLVDPQADVDAVLNALVGGFGHLPWPLLWLDAATMETPQWTSLMKAIERAGLAADYRERYRVGMIPLDGDWQTFQQRLSRNHRRNMGRYMRKLEQTGTAEVRVESSIAPDDVDDLLRRGFEVEDRCWKGRSGSSVMRTPGMYEFFLRQARQLAEWRQLELALLDFNGQPIAFHYAWNAKGVYHLFKIGYDEQFAASSPGQLLLHHVVERFHNEDDRRLIDCLGPVSEAVSKCQPATYGMGRLVVAPRSLLGRALFCGYKHIWPQIRRLREKRASKPEHVESQTSPADTAAAEPEEVLAGSK
jgi:CelD/BcsL family acetyltransferase involved in cellulose biosynthesis